MRWYRKQAVFTCPACDMEEFPDEIGEVTCECGATIVTTDALARLSGPEHHDEGDAARGRV